MDNETKHAFEVIKFNDYKIHMPIFSLYSNGKWISFDVDNLFPQKMIDLYNTSPTHSSIIKRMSTLILGDGIVYGENSKLNNWIKMVFCNVNEWIESVGRDYLIHNAIGSQVIWSNGGKSIGKVKYLDASKIRVGYDETKFFVSKDWCNYGHKMGRPIEMPALNSEISKEYPIQILYSFRTSPGNDWYPIPEYYGAINYVALDKGLAEYYNNFVQNGFSASYVITAYGKNLNPDETRELYRNIERKLIGPQAAGKFLLQTAPSKEEKWDFDALSTADNTKMYENLQKWSKQEIMEAHGVTAPEIVGSSSGGVDLGGDANKLATAYEIFQNTQIKPIQNKIINEILNLARMSGIICNDDDIFISSSIPVKAIDMQVLTVNERRKIAGFDAIEGQDIILSSVRFDKKQSLASQTDFGVLMLDLEVEDWEALKKMIDPEDVYVGDLEFGGIQEDPHVTVLYGYHSDVKPSEVMDSSEDFNATDFESDLVVLDTFESDEFDVLKFQVDSDELVGLNTKMRSMFSHTNTHDGYSPHVTLAYIKKGKGKKYIKTFQEGIKAKGKQFVFSYKNATKKLIWK